MAKTKDREARDIGLGEKCILEHLASIKIELHCHRSVNEHNILAEKSCVFADYLGNLPLYLFQILFTVLIYLHFHFEDNSLCCLLPPH